MIMIPYGILGFYLLRLSNYDSIFSLLDTTIISKTYISRIILEFISMATPQASRIILILITQLHLIDVAAIILFVMIYPMIEKKRIMTGLLVLLSIGIIGIFLCVWLGLQSSSLQGALIYLRIIGGILIVISIVLLIILICVFIKYLKQYRIAMQYRVEEIIEE
ncbi:MAG: hypothetical protein U0N20_04210 [Clostridium sp.]